VILLTLAVALAYPDRDPAEEELLPAISWTARGDWGTETAVQLEHPIGHGDNYWLVDASELTDGLIRARFDTTGKTHAALLYRAHAGDNPEDLDAYGLTIDGDSVYFSRWDDGVSLHSHEPIRVAGLSTHTDLEVVLFLTGAQHAAFVYDRATLQQLAALTQHDPKYGHGAVGLWQNPKRASTTLSALSVHRGETVDTASLEAPFGPERLVTIAANLPDLPSDFVVHPDGEQAHIVTDAAGLARLKQMGVTPLAVTGHVPWRYIDPLYPADPLNPGPGETKDIAAISSLLEAAHAAFPDITQLEQIGTSHLEHPIWALRIGDADDDNEPTVLIDAAHHGSELLSTEYALDVVNQLLGSYGKDKRITHWVDELDLWVVPLVNPDGNHAFVHKTHWAGRKNGRDIDDDGELGPWEGVDLNRNYPFRWGSLGEAGSRSYPLHYWYRGTDGGSEPEVQAMMALAEREHPVAAISFHTLATLILSPYTIDHVRNPTPDVPWQVAQTMAAAAGPQPNGKNYRVKRKIYPVDGVSQDWLYHELGTLAYIVEGSHHNPKTRATRTASIVGVRPVWQTLLDRVVDGPRISGRVVNADGNPLAARIEVLGVDTFEGEEWTARQRDGRFDRIVPNEGSWQIRVTHGSVSQEVTVNVKRGVGWVDVQL
jgi:hypothetical protein